MNLMETDDVGMPQKLQCPDLSFDLKKKLSKKRKGGRNRIHDSINPTNTKNNE